MRTIIDGSANGNMSDARHSLSYNCAIIPQGCSPDTPLCGNSDNDGQITNRYYGEDGLATNLKERNNGIARQSSIVDEIIATKHHQHCNFFPWNRSEDGNSSNDHNIIDNISRQRSFVPDDLVSNLSRRVKNLSVAERQEAQNDIYGTRLQDRNEDPLELCAWMTKMDDIIRKAISGNDERFSALRLAINTHGDSNGNNPNTNNTNNNSGIGTNTSGAEYVRSQKLKFLRARDWNVESSVERMALFFEVKLEHFGSKSLIRDLTINDLTPADLELWKRYGFLQLSKERDGFGRPIVILFPKQQQMVPVDTVIRCYLYLTSTMAQDETIQLSGITHLLWFVGIENPPILGRAMQLLLCIKALPLRMVSYHLCYDNITMKEIFELVAQRAATWGTIRARLHMGTAMECSYNILTYGISWNHIPINNEGEVELDFLHSSLEAIERKEQADDQKRRQQGLRDIQIQQLQLPLENQIPYKSTIGRSRGGQGIPDRRGAPYQRDSPIMPTPERFSLLSRNGIIMKSTPLPNSTNKSQTSYNTASRLPQQNERKNDQLIVVPGVLDVIMGRGQRNNKYPGNQKFNKLIETYQKEYEESNKFHKTVLSEVVVSIMNEDGTRFLIREGNKKEGAWVEVSFEKARDKVAHDFRNLRRNAKLAKIHAGVGSMSEKKIGARKQQRSQVDVAEGQTNRTGGT